MFPPKQSHYRRAAPLGVWGQLLPHRAWALQPQAAPGALPSLAVLSPCGCNKEMEQAVVVLRRQSVPLVDWVMLA